MNYQQSKQYIQNCIHFSEVKVAQKKQDFGLETIRFLLEKMGNPSKQLRFVHVAGTNGKGSFVAYLENILCADKIKVGAFTSPYLEEYTEMIRMNGQEISQEQFAREVSYIQTIIEKENLAVSEYECLVAVALSFFARENCSLVIWETALGSDKDVTNVIDVPVLTVMMAIGYDHMNVLGQTLEQITESECSILKPTTTLLTTIQKDIVHQKIQSICQQKEINWIQTQPVSIVSLENGVLFDYKEMKEIQLFMHSYTQAQNAATAIEAALFFGIDRKAIYQGLKQTYWPGRFEIIQKEPLVILDGGHNTSCLEAFIQDLQQAYPKTSFHWIVGMYKDKEVQAMMEKISGIAKQVHCIQAPSKRACLPETLNQYCSNGIVCTSFDQAMKQTENQPTVIFGSLSLVPLAKTYFNKR